MKLDLTEVGRRIGISRTTVRRRIDAGKINAQVDPETGYLVVDEEEVERYKSLFVAYIPPEEKTSADNPQHSQHSHSG